ncbi:chaperonin-containing T-complex subunit [Starmerella bacillaris]|uniref:T-complex protein 1 subunit gamma n=1 Tax=Starmerella bacillaris TaxID=1247836 RepID=A0AAV5RRN4_STABA|nr:chaperonin-containing T-complex subunit [Starmerella bacillaris]
MQAPVVFVNTGATRETGRQAQISNITAAKAVADIVRTCLGPKAMLKMLLDPVGGIVMTNDGHAILREIEVTHPAAKSMIELSRAQDEEVGDGTTSVIILAGEILAQTFPYLERKIHPVVIISALKKALEDAIQVVHEISRKVDTENDEELLQIIGSSIGTKYISKWSEHMTKLALKAVRTVATNEPRVESTQRAPHSAKSVSIDIKHYIRVEKITGGDVTDSEVLDGVMLNKDITHPKMRRFITNPRVLLLDCPLEYKKGESQTDIEITNEKDWARILSIEEEQVEQMCKEIVKFKPDVVITEKGVSDLAQHHLMKANITVLRRVRKMDNNRIARATGATVVSRVDEIKEADIGTRCGVFKVETIGDEYYSFLVECKDPGACTVLLRGASKDILSEIERNLQDAMAVARNVLLEPYMSPGGGATEMAVSVKLASKAKEIEGVEQWPYMAVVQGMEVIPRTLVQNCGGNPLRQVTSLRAKHAEGLHTYGIDGDSGEIVDMATFGIWEPEAVKLQSIKTAIESSTLLLRVDDIVSAKRRDGEGKQAEGAPPMQMGGMGGMPGGMPVME